MDTMHPETHIGTQELRALGITKLNETDRAKAAALPPLISVDSHVQEPDAVWDDLPPKHREVFRAALARTGFTPPPMPGAGEPNARLADMTKDGIQAEIIFPNNGMVLFGLEDVETQQAGMRVYNDFLADFCKTDPKRMFGVTALSVYDIDEAVRELHRGLSMGLTGAMVWQVPDPKLPFTSEHYDPLWAACAEADAPVHLHILTGHSYARTQGKLRGADKIRGAVNMKQNDTITSLFDWIFSGIFDRHPTLKMVLAESECGWLPFILQQWDYYYDRFYKTEKMPIARKPSEIFFEHVFCTWLEDYSGTRQFTWWGQDNLMWSNDYPHPNMTFPYSRENVIHHIGNLDRPLQMKLLRDNAIKLYNFKLN